MLLEIVLTVVILVGILFFVGMPLESILNLLVIVIGAGVLLTVAFVVLFFLGTDIYLLFFRKVKGEFLRIDEEGRFDHAVYRVGEQEYACIFPAESVARKQIYKKRMYTLLIPRFGKRKTAFDRHSLFIILCGTLLSLVLIGLTLFVVFHVLKL